MLWRTPPLRREMLAYVSKRLNAWTIWHSPRNTARCSVMLRETAHLWRLQAVRHFWGFYLERKWRNRMRNKIFMPIFPSHFTEKDRRISVWRIKWHNYRIIELLELEGLKDHPVPTTVLSKISQSQLPQNSHIEISLLIPQLLSVFAIIILFSGLFPCKPKGLF